AEEIAIPEQQHILLEEPQEVVGHGDLTAGARLDQGAPKDMAAGLAQGQDTRLGERRGGAATAGASEGPEIGWGIGHVHDEAVERHGPHAPVERPGGLTGYPITFSCDFRYLNGTGFFD